MNIVRVVAFDGTPVNGGGGIRSAILQRNDGLIVTNSGRRLEAEDFARLVTEGYVTSIVDPIEAAYEGGVVAYRHRNFVFPGITFNESSEIWAPSGDVVVSYLNRSEAVTVFQRYAQFAYLLARMSLTKRELDDVRRFARRGLMVVPHLRNSVVAAQLYGVLLAAESLGEQHKSTKRELEIMLDRDLIATALEEASTALRRHRSQPSELRRADRRLEVGTLEAPREAA